ncbi:hypothetical protein Q7P37_002404 [Cladosporium fusiforme]
MSVQSVNIRQPLAAVSRGKDLIDLVVVGANSQMYHKAYDKSGWQDWASLGGDFADEAPALVTVDSKRLDVFARDRTTKRLMHSAWTNGSWATEWDDQDDLEFERRFAVLSSQSGQIDLFGTAAGRLYYRSIVNESWNDWQNWYGPFLSELAPASWSAGHLAIFGVGNDSQMWQKTYDAATGGWPSEKWETSQLPDSQEDSKTEFASDPTVAAWPSRQLHLFVVGTLGSYANQCHYRKYSDGEWDDYAPIAGTFRSQLSVVAWGEGRLDVVGLGTDMKVWYRYIDSKELGWRPEDWEYVAHEYDKENGLNFSTAPIIVSWGPGNLGIFAMAQVNGSIMYISGDGVDWGNWTSIGELPAGAREATASSTSSVGWIEPVSTSSGATSSASTPAPISTDNSTLGTGAIVGIAVGLGIVAIVAATGFWYWRRVHKRSKSMEAAHTDLTVGAPTLEVQANDTAKTLTQVPSVHELQNDQMRHIPMSNPIADTSGTHELGDDARS